MHKVLVYLLIFFICGVAQGAQVVDDFKFLKETLLEHQGAPQGELPAEQANEDTSFGEGEEEHASGKLFGRFRNVLARASYIEPQAKTPQNHPVPDLRPPEHF